MEGGSRISVPAIPYSFQVEVETELITETNDDFNIMLGDMPEGGSFTNKINLHIDVIGNKFTPSTMSASCDDTEMNNLVIANRGTDTWTFKVKNTYIEFFLNGVSVISDGNNCLMDEVKATNVIQFGSKDDISKRFRLQPGEWPFGLPSSTFITFDCISYKFMIKIMICKQRNDKTGGQDFTNHQKGDNQPSKN